MAAAPLMPNKFVLNVRFVTIWLERYVFPSVLFVIPIMKLLVTVRAATVGSYSKLVPVFLLPIFPIVSNMPKAMDNAFSALMDFSLQGSFVMKSVLIVLHTTC